MKRRSSIGVAGPLDLTKDFSTRFSLPSFIKQVRRLKDDQRTIIEQMGFGNLLLVSNQTLNKKLLVELMARWSSEKQAFILHSGEIRITLMDVALILGLRVVGLPVLLKDNEPFSDVEREYGAVLWKRKIKIAFLEERLESLDGKCNDDFIRTFLLYAFGTFLFPNSNGQVDSRYLSFLKNVDSISQFAWGTAVVQDILQWLTRRKDRNVQYVGGCLLFLQIWAYEHIDIARPALLDTCLTFPRVCRWDKSRSHQSRQQIGAKLKALQDQQVVWELKPFSWELEEETIRELLEAQANQIELSDAENSDFPALNDNTLRTISGLINQQIIELETESEVSLVDEGRSDEDVNLDHQVMPQNVPEILLDTRQQTSTSSEKQEQQKSASTPVDSCTIVISDDEEEENPKMRAGILEEQNTELIKENNKLKGENELLRGLLGCSFIKINQLLQTTEQRSNDIFTN
ncbi:hypothetical protein UlMin_000785 [Ulmus minor]